MSTEMMSVVGDFNASVYVSEQLNRQLVNMSQDLSMRCVNALAEKYGFNADEEIRLLGLSTIKVERKSKPKAKSVTPVKASVEKSRFPLPYSGEFNDSLCYALRQNKGLYTQCQGVRKGEAKFCKSCATSMQKTGSEEPEYGTIQQRMATDIFEYTDPKGRKPVAYTKVMKKYKITKEDVMEEAGKFNIVVDEKHFDVPVDSVKKPGRPKTEKEEKIKGAKGRPKKDKKVLSVEDDESDDLFATLVAKASDNFFATLESNSFKEEDDAGESAEAAEAAKKEKEEKLAAEKAEKAAKKEAEKEAKRLADEAAKKEKEEKLAAEKAEKAAKKEAERLAKEEEKEAKRLAAEAAKKEKEEKLAAEKAEKAAKKGAEKEAKRLAAEAAKKEKESKSAKKAAADEDEEEPDVVKKIEFEGKKYLKSKKTGICYDYSEYVTNGEQVVVGKFNDNTNKIDFEAAAKDEEEEEECE